jgi:hypothetical protein
MSNARGRSRDGPAFTAARRFAATQPTMPEQPQEDDRDWQLQFVTFLSIRAEAAG